MKKTFILILSIILLSANAYNQVPNYVPTNGLIGWWPFDGNANDASGNGNHGTVNGPVLTTGYDSSPNSAYSFSSNYIDVPNNSSLNPGNGITIATWVYLDQYVQNQNFISKCYTSYSLPYISYSLKMLGVSPYNLVDFELALNGVRTVDTSASAISLNEWTHLAVTYNGSMMKIYINGVLDSYRSVTGNISAYATNLNFGRASVGVPTNPQYLDGSLDDAGMWNRALTDQEVMDLYLSVDGIEDNEGSDYFSLFPNPATDQITIKTEALSIGTSYIIYDLLGNVVLSGNLTNQNQIIEIGDLSEGMYFLQLGELGQQTFVKANN